MLLVFPFSRLDVERRCIKFIFSVPVYKRRYSNFLWDRVVNNMFVKKPGFEVLILQAPCFTNEPKLFWQHHTGCSLSRPPVSRMQLPAVFFVDQPKRKQQGKVSTDRLCSYSRQIDLHIWGRKTKTFSVTNRDSAVDYIPPSCGIINRSQKFMNALTCSSPVGCLFIIWGSVSVGGFPSTCFYAYFEFAQKKKKRGTNKTEVWKLVYRKIKMETDWMDHNIQEASTPLKRQRKLWQMKISDLETSDQKINILCCVFWNSFSFWGLTGAYLITASCRTHFFCNALMATNSKSHYHYCDYNHQQ